MPDAISPDVALSILRGLAGVKDYPFHVEGEKRRAAVLIECCESVGHARQVIEEFDAAEDFNCVTGDALRSAAKRLAEVCECGKAKWAHREGDACRRFAGAETEEEKLVKAPTGYSQFKDSIEMIPGVPWGVALQVEAIRIHLGHRSIPRDEPKLSIDTQRYPEATQALYERREPDYKVLEAQMRALNPHMWKGSKRLGGEVRTVTERIAQIESVPVSSSEG